MSGSLPQLLLLPPIGHEARLFEPLARALEGRVEVHALDYPGFGDRPASLDLDAPGLLDRLCDDVRHEVSHRGVAPTLIGGVSLGGTLCHALAETLTPPPRGVVLMAAGGLRVARIRREVVLAQMNELGPARFARQHLGLDHPELERSSLRTHFGRVTDDVHTYFRHFRDVAWAQAAFEDRARASVAMLAAALFVDEEPRMARARTPTAVVWGERDRIFNRKYVTKLCARIPTAAFHPLPGVGHYPPLEAPDAVARIIAALASSEKDPQ